MCVIYIVSGAITKNTSSISTVILTMLQSDIIILHQNVVKQKTLNFIPSLFTSSKVVQQNTILNKMY